MEQGHTSAIEVFGIRKIEQEEMAMAGLVENPVGFADGHVETTQTR